MTSRDQDVIARAITRAIQRIGRVGLLKDHDEQTLAEATRVVVVIVGHELADHCPPLDRSEFYKSAGIYTPKEQG